MLTTYGDKGRHHLCACVYVYVCVRVYMHLCVCQHGVYGLSYPPGLTKC